jgi:hypothetical protein
LFGLERTFQVLLVIRVRVVAVVTRYRIVLVDKRMREDGVIASGQAFVESRGSVRISDVTLLSWHDIYRISLHGVISETRSIRQLLDDNH